MRTALVGCGVIAPTHIDALLKLGHEVVALCDIEIQRCVDLAQRFSLNARYYPDYSEMLKGGGIDAVHIATPHYLHAPMVIEALAKDINCLCEKPLCIKKCDLGRIESAVKKSKATLGVCFQNRYLSANKSAKILIGEEKSLSGNAVQIWRRDEAYYRQDDWRGKWETEGGGVLINQAIHAVDMLIWLLGTPRYVTASITNHSLRGVVEVEDTAELYMEMEGGKKAQLYATNASTMNFPLQICLHTDKSRIEIKNNDIYINNIKIDLNKDEIDIVAKEYWGNGHYRLIEDFYRCISQGKDFPIDFYEGAKAVNVLLSAYESKGKRTEINNVY